MWISQSHPNPEMQERETGRINVNFGTQVVETSQGKKEWWSTGRATEPTVQASVL